MSNDQNELKDIEDRAPLISVRNLSVEFGNSKNSLKAVNNVSFELFEGETVAILGESGSGKSVTSLSIMGLLPKSTARITNGKIYYKDKDIIKMTDTELKNLRGTEISMIFQDPLSALNPLLKVGYQISEGLRHHNNMSKKEAQEKAVKLMKSVKIPDAERRVNNYPYQFSGGMQQRVMIAMALALDPNVLIADEPTTALDVTVQAQIMRLLKDLQIKRKMGLILVSHDLGVVADVADRVVVMYASSIVESGDIKEVFQTPSHPYTLGLMGSVPTVTKERTRLVPIKGSPPTQTTRIEGCTFYPRCPFAKEICKIEKPELREIFENRKSACHFAEEVLSDVEREEYSHS